MTLLLACLSHTEKHSSKSSQHRRGLALALLRSTMFWDLAENHFFPSNSLNLRLQGEYLGSS